MKNNLTLVLNADDTPLNVASVYRAFNLVFKGKAVVVTHDEARPLTCEQKEFLRPTIIRLVNYIVVPYRKALPLTRTNIYKRDDHQCMYCPSTKKLTLDHVLPKSRGGKNTWENLVTCCARCNSKKDNKTPSEAGMTLRKKPHTPSYRLSIISSPTAHSHWGEYFADKKQYN